MSALARPCDFCQRPLPPHRKHLHEECVEPEIEAMLDNRLPFIRNVAPPPPADPGPVAAKRANFAERSRAGRARMAMLDVSDLRRRLAAGETYTTIALAYGVDPKTIRLRARKLGISREARAA